MKSFLKALILLFITYGHAQQINPNPWTEAPDPEAATTYTNPIIPGFYSDPSVCRVGEDYYLVTSTFEYFPGVPVFHSKDLVNWKQIGHAIHRKEQFPEKLNIFAPTIRYHEGTFYMITTNVADKGNFYVTATDPAGPWSDPIWFDMGGIDPDLFFDDNGKTYVISNEFELAEIELKTGKLLSGKTRVWNGTGGRYPEAPHIFKKDGFYYLMAAEGGTEEAHMVTIARSNTIEGPYIDNPANPIVTHVNMAGAGNPIQGVGHADMVQAHDESWWMVFHGYRSIAGYPPHHTLGRETCLAPVSWPKGGWPVVNGNGTVSETMSHPTLPLQPHKPNPVRTDFNENELGLEWNFVQLPNEEDYHLDQKAGTLTLKGSALTIGEDGSPAFMGRRLTDIKFAAMTRMEFDPGKENEEAGMTLLNNGSHFDLTVFTEEEKRFVGVKLQFGQTIYHSQKYELAKGPVDLKIEGTGPEFIFSFKQKGEEFTTIEKADARFLSTETVGWFTGVYVGFYATGHGKDSKSPAVYHWFEYTGE